MKKDIVTVIYDRKKTSTRRGKGKVEARIYLSRTARKYITLGEATPEEREQYEREDKFADIRKRYEDILVAMEVLGKDMTIASFNVCAGLEAVQPTDTAEGELMQLCHMVSFCQVFEERSGIPVEVVCGRFDYRWFDWHNQ